MGTDFTIGLAMIARNEEQSLARLLPQLCNAVDADGRRILDQIVIVDTGSTDKTKEVIAQYPVETYDFEWVGDFSAARNFSFSKLTTDFTGWLDCDDEVEGLDKLRVMLGHIWPLPNVSALWCCYLYDRTADGNWVAMHDRERFVKRGHGWRWINKVHEHMVTDTPGSMAYCQEISVKHLRDISRDPERNQRNIDILRTILRENRKEPRAWFDLGSQYYHGQRWGRSLAAYRRFCRLHQGALEKYQALHRMADCWRALNQPDKAIPLEHQAAQLHPEWKDAWFGLADAYAQKGEYQLALNFNALADPEKFGTNAKPLGMPERLLVLNPLDYTFHPILSEHRSLNALGQVPDALGYVATGIQIVPSHPEMIAAKSAYESWLKEKDATDATLALARVATEGQFLDLYRALPESLQNKKEVRDVLVYPTLRERKADVVFWCGPSLENWGPETPNTTGIGGSETAVIALAEGLSRKGLNVDVLNQCGRQEGWHGAVRYIDYQRWEQGSKPRLFVAWRNPQAGRLAPLAAERWLWVHDLNLGPGFQAHDAAPFQIIRPVSQWHGDHLAWLYPFLKGRIVPTRNGIDPTRFERAGRDRNEGRNLKRAVWLSSPDRGLDHLLAMWPEVMKRVGDAELRIYYGVENIFAAAQRTQDVNLARFGTQIQEMAKQPGVTWRGRVTQKVLAEELQTASVLAYSSHFLETNCISAVEAMAAGMVVLSTVAGAIPETTGGAALLVRGHPNSAPYRQAFTHNLLTLFEGTASQSAEEIRAPWVERGYVRAAELTWQGVIDEWAARLAGVPRFEEEAVAV